MLLPSADALDALKGQGRFTADGKLPLRAIAALGDDVLVVLDAYPPDRARTLANAIAGSKPLASKAVAPKRSRQARLRRPSGKRKTSKSTSRRKRGPASSRSADSICAAVRV